MGALPTVCHYALEEIIVASQCPLLETLCCLFGLFQQVNGGKNTSKYLSKRSCASSSSGLVSPWEKWWKEDGVLAGNWEYDKAQRMFSVGKNWGLGDLFKC